MTDNLNLILYGCKIALAQGRFRWRHNQVLRKLAELIESKRVLAPGSDWPMRHDITTATLRPDIVLWLIAEKKVFIMGLTVPQEGAIQEAYERKKSRYAELVAGCQQRSWRATTYPVEVSCRGFVRLSTNQNPAAGT